MSADTHNSPAPEPPEESGLMSDSTYEVINNTDTESQDGFPTESVCSSDYLRGDDVHSLVGTEYTGDDNDEDRHGDDADADEGVVVPSQAQDVHAEHAYAEAGDAYSDSEEERIKDDGTYSDSDEEEHITTDLLDDRPQVKQDPNDTAGSAATLLDRSPEDEKNRTSALQYAEESLETPSASIHAEMVEREKRLAFLGELHDIVERSLASVYTVLSVIGFLFLLGGTYVLMRCTLTPSGRSGPGAIVPTQPIVPIVQTTVSVSTSTMIINYTSTKTVLISETRTAAPSFSTTETLLLPSSPPQPPRDKSTEGKGICSAEVQSPQEILLKMPHNTKLYWLAKDSISIEVARGEEAIKAKFSSVDEGILIEIPKMEARGVVNVSVITTRRPKVNETFAVDFGLGIVDRTMDLGRLLAQDLADMFASATSESARRAEELKGAASEAWESLDRSFAAAGEEVKSWRERFSGGPPNPFQGAQERVSGVLAGWNRRAREVEDEMALSLLRAQISAKVLWLRMKGDKEEHDVFVSKARKFMQQRVVEASVRRAGHGGNAGEGEGARTGKCGWMGRRKKGCGLVWKGGG
ncbi:uncharacterized protein DNG_05731 [Cephalotrichum gorgonifer]|uniref:Uncharacterized protein n=1 Tax=Cephalotrichum gorgonifer TaxID=2041049 RepID=A0AAE8MYR3_9PEZI|nr:uncharacterized protein DNG_05731 [Cephalotrichum gorgonifer]